MNMKNLAAIFAAMMAMVVVGAGVASGASPVQNDGGNIEQYLVTANEDGTICVKLASALEEPCMPEAKWPKWFHAFRLFVDWLDDTFGASIAGSTGGTTGGVTPGVEGCPASTAANACSGSFATDASGAAVLVTYDLHTGSVSADYYASQSVRIPIGRGPCPFVPAPPCAGPLDQSIFFGAQ